MPRDRRRKGPRGPAGADVSERSAAIRSLIRTDQRFPRWLRHVTEIRHFPREPANTRDFPDHIEPTLREAYRRRGVSQVWSHQREALDRVEAGESVVVVTPTASGKTLCYMAPVVNRILREPDARALFLFPTKALSRDQSHALRLLGKAVREAGGTLSLGAEVYDGDTPAPTRRTIRERARVVTTNPDMLHAGILPHHTKWAKLFENLRFVVVDEMHTYRGVFGSHLTNLFRRLRRVCRHYGSDPQFILSSATIRNPRELAEGLTERSVALVDRSGAPRPERYFLFYNPPVVNRQLGLRRSALNEARRIAGSFLRRHLQTIVFARSRTHTEVLTKYLKRDFERRPDRKGQIRGYRGGLLPKERRRIEADIRSGAVRGVVSTNALELGMDIGQLDVTVMAGYPGTIASSWQQAGRAGRRGGTAAAVLVANSSPVNQFLIGNPDYFFGATPEQGLINPDNLQILMDHVKCAAFELPFQEGETFGGEDLEAILGLLEEEGILLQAGPSWYWTADSYPANSVSLRSVSSDNFVVHNLATARIIAEVDFVSAHSMLHEKAIYMVQSETFIVERFDHRNRRAEVRPLQSDYYTDAITHQKVRVLDEFVRASRPPALHGEVHVVKQVVGFKKIRFFTGENVGSGDLDMPAVEMQTTAFWLEIAPEVLAAAPFGWEGRRDGVVGIRNTLRAVATTVLMCEPHDIGAAISTERPPEADDGGPLTRVFIYDDYPGGIGFSEPLWKERKRLLEDALGLIRQCACPSGCPSCVGPAGEIGPEGKQAALWLLGTLGRAMPVGWRRPHGAPASSPARTPLNPNARK